MALASHLENFKHWVMKMEETRHRSWCSLWATVYFSACTAVGCPIIRVHKAEPVFDSILSFFISTEYLYRPEICSAGVLHEFIPMDF